MLIKYKFQKENLMIQNHCLNISSDRTMMFIRPLCIKFPQMIGFVKHFNSNKAMYFKVIDSNLFTKYTKIWERASSLRNIEFDSEPISVDNKNKVIWR